MFSNGQVKGFVCTKLSIYWKLVVHKFNRERNQGHWCKG